MPKFRVEKSIEINAPAARVRQAIQDYTQWSTWSPWFCMEPDAKLTIEGTVATPGHAYTWEGDMIGAGRMVLERSEGNTDYMDLSFLKPFKSKADIKFNTTALSDNTTQVTWHMDSGLPFFMFFMVGTMKAMIGMDYDRGLKLLKEYLETDAVTSKTEIVGVVDVSAIPYTGVASASQLSDIADSMKAAFIQLSESSKGLPTADYCGAIYHDLDIKSQHCKYTVFAPVAEEVVETVADSTDTIPQCRALKVIHTGDYQHLGNGWATANTYQRHKKLKKNKSVAPFELYLNDPESVPAKDLVTEIYLPVNA